MKKIFFIILLLIPHLCKAQELKVTRSPDGNKINREVSAGTATIVFESGVNDLSISNDMCDECLQLTKDMTVFLIQPESEEYVRELGFPKRTYILKTPKTSEYLLQLNEIMPNNVYYYTVTMPNRFPCAFTAEYLFSKSTRYGFRLSFGKQIGGYISYRWGKYKPSGNSIDGINIDGNVSNAKYLGYIREAITGGIRVGVLYNDILKSRIGLYLLVGGGYGEYGRQWQNPTQLDGNIYFYSDYIKGFNGDVAIQCTVGNWVVVSVGADALFSKDRTSIDYQLGVGLNLNFTKLFKQKSK
jgi:hypothetical protein